MAVETAKRDSMPGVTGEDVEPPDWNSIAWGVARLLSTSLVAAFVGLLVAEVTLRLGGVSPRRSGHEIAFDLDGETAGVFQAGSQFQDQWKPAASLSRGQPFPLTPPCLTIPILGRCARTLLF